MATPWQGNTQGALAFLALQFRGLTASTTTVVNPGPPQGTPGPSPEYLHHHWVSYKSGSNAAPATGAVDVRGRIGAPWKTLQAACNAVAAPVTTTQALEVHVFHVMDAKKPANTDAVITLPPSRRIVIDAPGVHLPDLLWNVDGGVPALSGIPPALVIMGAPGYSDFDAQAGFNNTPGTCVVGSDNGGNGVALRMVSIGTTAAVATVLLADVGLFGGIVTDPSAKSEWTQGAPVIRARDSGFFDTGGGPGISSTSTGKPTLGVFTNCWLHDAMVIDVRTVQGFVGGINGADITVAAIAADAGNKGFTNCKLTASFKWTGANSSMFLDGVTNYWATAAGSTIDPADKVITEDVTP